MKFKDKEFYFIRHGESEFNANPNLDERLDYALTHKGRKQAESLQPIVRELPITTICVSPLRRAIETKDIVSRYNECNVIIIDALRECNMEVWNKMMELEKNPDLKPSCKHVRKFMDQAVEGITQALSFPGPVLVVAHGGIHWAMCHQFEIENYEKKIDNCVPAHFKFGNDFRWEARHLATPCIF